MGLQLSGILTQTVGKLDMCEWSLIRNTLVALYLQPKTCDFSEIH